MKKLYSAQSQATGFVPFHIWGKIFDNLLVYNPQPDLPISAVQGQTDNVHEKLEQEVLKCQLIQ